MRTSRAFPLRVLRTSRARPPRIFRTSRAHPLWVFRTPAIDDLSRRGSGGQITELIVCPGEGPAGRYPKLMKYPEEGSVDRSPRLPPPRIFRTSRPFYRAGRGTQNPRKFLFKGIWLEGENGPVDSLCWKTLLEILQWCFTGFCLNGENLSSGRSDIEVSLARPHQSTAYPQ